MKAELFGLRAQWGRYRGLHQQACERERVLKEKVAELEARVRELGRELFAAKSERRRGARKPGESQPTSGTPRRPRGHPPGAPGHGRKGYAHLPVEEEWVELAEEDRCCPVCGLPFEEVGGSEDSEQVEVEVRAYRRRFRRRRYRPTCGCAGLPAVIVAPRAPKLIPKGLYGVSVWVEVLLDKYGFLRPTHRLVEDLETHELELSAGTVTDGLRRLAPLFEPLVAGIAAHNVAEKQWHADETGWRVFAAVEGKVGTGWWLWVFAARSSVLFVLDPSRGRRVPAAHLAGVEEGVLVVDRLAAYKALGPVKAGKILLGFCWAHVRRDYLRVAKDWPGQAAWGNEWLDAIGELFALNALRREALEDPAAFAPRDEAVRQAVERLAARRDAELAQADLHPARRRALESLRTHWQGLTLFVERPEVAMDNNEAERQLRGPVVGRKTFYGSGALWAGRLAAALFSLLATLRRWRLNPRRWLAAYLEACAAHGGQPPPDAASFLPWNLSEARRRDLAGLPRPDT